MKSTEFDENREIFEIKLKYHLLFNFFIQFFKFLLNTLSPKKYFRFLEILPKNVRFQM